MPKKYKKAIVAIDGSESGFHALRESFKFACEEKFWITVVCISPSYEGDLDSVALNSILDTVKAPCLNALKQAKEMATQAKVLIKTVLEEGEPYQKIIDIAEEEDAEIIIMGRRGLSRLERAFLGSVTARVIGHSQREVLIVPQHAIVKWDSILLAIDGSRYSMSALYRAVDLAQAYKSKLVVLSVVDVPTEFYAEANHIVDELISKAKRDVHNAAMQAAKLQIETEGIVKEGNTSQVIVNTAKDMNIDAIVMASHGKTGIRRLLMGSVTEKVIGYSHCPVLVVKG